MDKLKFMVIFVVIIVVFLCIFVILNKSRNGKVGDLESTFVSCGDADMSIITYHDYVVVIDTGEDICESHVLDVLDKKNIKKIDYMILTHPDKDHIGNAEEILKKYDVNKVYVTDYMKESEIEALLYDYCDTNNVNVEVVLSDKNILLDDVSLEISPPDKKYNSSNNMSLVTYLKYKKVVFFFGGDIEKKRISRIVDKLDKADIVKMPYHGRYIDNMNLLLDKLEPKFVIMTSSKEDKDTINLLEERKIKYTYTIDDVVITSDGKSWSINN